MNKYGAQNMFSELKSVLINIPLKDMGNVDCKKWHYQEPLNQNKDYQILIPYLLYNCKMDTLDVS